MVLEKNEVVFDENFKPSDLPYTIKASCHEMWNANQIRSQVSKKVNKSLANKPTFTGLLKQKPQKLDEPAED